MKRFVFTLHSVLMLKQKNLENERIKLARIINIYNKQKEALIAIVETFNKLQKEADEYVQKSNFNLEMIASYRAYARKLEQSIKTQQAIVDNTQKELSNQQIIANKAYIEVKTLEKLKEKQKENYNKELLQEEIRTIDDITSSRFQRAFA